MIGTRESGGFAWFSVRESLLELDGVKILEGALTALVRAIPPPGGRTMRHPGEAFSQMLVLVTRSRHTLVGCKVDAGLPVTARW